METQNTINLKLAMKESWQKEYSTFLLVPLLATSAYCFISLFWGEQSMNSMTLFPIYAAYFYGYIFSPRRPYEESWRKIMEYNDFILANTKRVLLFGAPTGLVAWITTILLKGYPKELAMFFETAIWGFSFGIFVGSLIAYVEETSKLKKINLERYELNLRNLWKWIIPPSLVLTLLAVSKTFLLLNLLQGRA